MSSRPLALLFLGWLRLALPLRVLRHISRGLHLEDRGNKVIFGFSDFPLKLSHRLVLIVLCIAGKADYLGRIYPAIRVYVHHEKHVVLLFVAFHRS